MKFANGLRRIAYLLWFGVSTPLGTMGLLAALIVLALALDLGCAALSPAPVKTTADRDAASAAAGVVAYQSAFGAGAAIVVGLSVLAVTILGLALRRVALALVEALRRSRPCELHHAAHAASSTGAASESDTARGAGHAES